MKQLLAKPFLWTLLIVVVIWHLCTEVLGFLDPFLFPSPGRVLSAARDDQQVLLKHILASGKLLCTGYGLALLLGISIGLLAGWNKRLQAFVRPLASAASPIPPIVYIPYAIALLPSFFLSSAFVVFIGSFWPILINTLNGVVNIDNRLLDSAKTLKLSTGTMLRRILLPSALPGIFTGAGIGLVFSFILLTAAELIGGSAGLGYYVKYFTDFGDYPRVILGIIVIGICVSILMFIVQRIEKYCLKWKAN